MENKMFCFQCQETAGGNGCTQVGVCGKKPEVAAMQDLLVYVTKGLSAVTTRLRAEGKSVKKGINHLVTENLFMTITNANFDYDAIAEHVSITLRAKGELMA
ncbi:MAG: hydroxylamine reductase, partial [Mitsuokella sp.]